MIFTSQQSGDWFSPGTWAQNGFPGAADSVQIYHDVILSQNAAVGDTTGTAILIAPGASLSLSANITLTVYGGVSNEGDLDLADGALLDFNSGLPTIPPAPSVPFHYRYPRPTPFFYGYPEV